MANLYVSDAFLSSPNLVLSPQAVLSSRKCMQPSSVVCASSSRLRTPRRRIEETSTSFGFNWTSTVGTSVEYEVSPTSVPVRVAYELLLAGHRFLDVRTPEEFSAGHAFEAINVPYMFKVGSGMIKNSNFLEEVLSHFGKDDEVIIGCQSGKRSQMAAVELMSAGFTGITDIAGGYAAWMQNGLPNEQ